MAKWQAAYDELCEYIRSNPDIEIRQDSSFIPSGLRQQFFNRFDRINSIIIAEFFSRELDMARELAGQFKTLEAEVTGLLGIQPKIKVAAGLRWLIDEPENGLSRPLFGLLFDLIKDKLDPESFEEEVKDKVGSLFSSMYKSGYEKWIILALIKWLNPVRALTLPLHQINLYASGSEGDSQYEQVEVLPETKKLEQLTFDYSNWVSFTVPELIVYSEKLDKYVSIRDGFTRPHWVARYVSSSRFWLPLEPILKFLNPAGGWPNITVLTGSQISDVHLVADKKRLCRPDVIIETMEKNDWFSEPVFTMLEAHSRLIQPKKLAVISRLEIPSRAKSRLIETGEIGISRDEETGEVTELPPAGPLNEDATERRMALTCLVSAGFDQPVVFQALERCFKTN